MDRRHMLPSNNACGLRTHVSHALASAGFKWQVNSGSFIRQSWRFEETIGQSASLHAGEIPRENQTGLETFRKNLISIEERLSDHERQTRARQRVEAILFLSREPLSNRKISQLACLEDATQARTIIRQLNDIYRQEQQAWQIEEASGGFILLTRPQYSRWLRRLEHVPSDVRLGLPTLETLTIIAYRQPVMRSYIESVRGANCEDALRQLLERELIRIAGRSEDLGRPYVYETTKRFLQLFGLRSIEHLPKKEWVLQSPLQLANPVRDDRFTEPK
jgi:segregation and condensation protein B